MSSVPRPRSIAGVARAIIDTVGVDDAVDILIDHWGWDVAFQSLAILDGPDVGRALHVAVQRLGRATG